MCGIAGYVNGDTGTLSSSDLEKMMRNIRHRGPDAAGTYINSECGLGHLRLSIIDLSGGDQPMENEDGSLQIVFNGEIFNYIELREELMRKGHIFATRSDTEVILHMYEEVGEDCVSRFNGQWAFAIWDRRERKLFLSRDRLGVRPLFYTFAGGAFLFASEVKALFGCSQVSREIDIDALDQIFTFWHCLPPRTAFRGISELPPGHSAYVSHGAIRTRCYWDICYGSADSDLEKAEETAQEELTELLDDAVRIRLRSDVPVGAYLSGGLDSTLITALAKRYANKLRTFSVRFDESEFDEGPYQQEATLYLETEHHEVRCTNREIGEAFPQVVWHTEKPILRAAPAPLFILSRLVRDSGYKVVLTGEGADELFGGYDIFKECKIRQFWAAHPESKLRPLLLRRLYPYLADMQSQPASFLRLFYGVRPEDLESCFFSHLPRWRMTAKLKLFFSDEVRNALNGREVKCDLKSGLPESYFAWSRFARAQYLEARGLLPNYILSSQGDRVAMAHSVEGRFPFLDPRVVELSARLPARLKVKALREKYLLKRCAAGIVPPAVALRKKQPYRAPDAQSLLRDRSIGFVDDLLSPEQLRRDGLFDARAVSALVRKGRSGEISGAGDNMAAVGIISTQLLTHQYINHWSA
jgi:asparagine synthase (glutamine-hydrolysing)